MRYFQILKRFESTWGKMNKEFKKAYKNKTTHNLSIAQTIFDKMAVATSDDDVEGAARGLIRLQKLYR